MVPTYGSKVFYLISQFAMNPLNLPLDFSNESDLNTAKWKAFGEAIDYDDLETIADHFLIAKRRLHLRAAIDRWKTKAHMSKSLRDYVNNFEEDNRQESQYLSDTTMILGDGSDTEGSVYTDSDDDVQIIEESDYKRYKSDWTLNNHQFNRREDPAYECSDQDEYDSDEESLISIEADEVAEILEDFAKVDLEDLANFWKKDMGDLSKFSKVYGYLPKEYLEAVLKKIE